MEMISKSYEVRRLVLKTEQDIKKANRLQQWFTLRGDCQFEVFSNETKNTSNDRILDDNKQLFCPPTADYLTCFNATLANSTFYAKCPYKSGLEIKSSSKGFRFLFVDKFEKIYLNKNISLC